MMDALFFVINAVFNQLSTVTYQHNNIMTRIDYAYY